MEKLFELKHIKNIWTDIIRNMIPILMFILRILGKLNIKWMNGLIDWNIWSSKYCSTFKEIKIWTLNLYSKGNSKLISWRTAICMNESCLVLWSLEKLSLIWSWESLINVYWSGSSRPMLGLADCYKEHWDVAGLGGGPVQTPRHSTGLATAAPLTQGFIHSKSVWRGEGGELLLCTGNYTAAIRKYSQALCLQIIKAHIIFHPQISRFVINSTTSRKFSVFSFNSSLSSRKFYHGKLDSPSIKINAFTL